MSLPSAVLCACGSGLRPARCCEYDLAQRSPDDAGRLLLAFAEQAAQAAEAGDSDTAERTVLEVLELLPTQPQALRALARIRVAQGKFKAANALLKRLLAAFPNDVSAACELAGYLLQTGALAEAEIHARQAIRIAPEQPVAQNLLGMILTDSNRARAGEMHYRNVITLTGARDPVVLSNLAWNLTSQGRMQEARALFAEADAATPGNPRTLMSWAKMEEADRQFDRAKTLLDRSEAAAGGPSANTRLLRAVLQGRDSDWSAALALLPDGPPEATSAASPTEWLERGRLLDRVGRYGEAFACFDHGKRRLRALTGHAYRDAAAADLIERLKSFFSRPRTRFTPRAREPDLPNGAAPLFILGFPRSGTTLLEQVLSCHPRIAAADELPIIGELSQSLDRLLGSTLAYPEALCELWMGDRAWGIELLRSAYLLRAQSLGVGQLGDVQGGGVQGGGWFTDKMPLNEMHLGLIALMFPRSPLIHVIRHPLDAVLSAFSNQLSHGMHCAAGLESTALHYARIAELTEHYRAQMELRYLAVRYEDLVADLEGTVRKVLAFIGEEYDERCLRFTDNPRFARTASYAQVTQSLYGSSVYRYRNYRQQLEPAMKILQPTIERLGYIVE